MSRRKCERCGLPMPIEDLKAKVCPRCYEDEAAEMEADMLRDRVAPELGSVPILKGIVAEAECTLAGLDFVLHVQNIRKLSFILADRIKRFYNKGGEKHGS